MARIQFWCGAALEVHDGKITLWRDSFDFVDILRATVRGLAGLAMPSLAAHHRRDRTHRRAAESGQTALDLGQPLRRRQGLLTQY
ncbi:MAG: limonene-1,2-epoxide hydrolase family protein [Acidimicrobiia bacterium]|nr:limonene-1,2-epoxide hydrolase family protein [Acidimicrobiia bacterium]